jgi:hypothetical protein
MIGEFLSELFMQIFVNFFWRNIIGPLLRFTGGGLRFLFTLKKEAFKNEHNAVLGFFFWLIGTIVFFIIVKGK